MTQIHEHVNMPTHIAPTRNVVLLMELAERISKRSAGLPGMGTFFGEVGYGKTMAVCCVAVGMKAYYVQMKELWSKKYLLEQILRQMGIEPEKTMSYMLEQIGRQLGQSGRVLLIDDANILLERGMVGVAKDIFESSQGTLILVGEANLPQQLERIPRVHGRMLDWVEAQPTALADARLFAEKYASGVHLHDDVLEEIITQSNGSARYVCNNIRRVAEFAAMKGLEELTAQTYTGTFFTGAAPRARRARS